MPIQLVTVRYPGGDVEFRIAHDDPRVGDKFERDGAEWPVTKVELDQRGNLVVTLGSIDQESSAQKRGRVFVKRHAGSPPRSFQHTSRGV